MGRGRRHPLIAAGVLALLLAAGPAHAAFPGENGMRGFGDQPRPPGAGPFYGLRWSPDGTRFAALKFGGCDPYDGTCSYVVATYASDGTDERVIRDENGRTVSYEATGVTWSSDGKQLAWTEFNKALRVVNADGTGRRLLRYDNLRWVEDPAWAPDGTGIAYVDSGIKCYSFDKLRPCYLNGPSGGYRLSWSPDASRIAFTKQTPDGSWDVHVLHRTTGAVQRLTSDPASDVPSSWSPDGTKIAFYRGSEQYVMDPDGGNQRPMSGPGGDWQPLPVNTPSTHLRPMAANKAHISLVPAFNECTSPDRQHGPPLAAGSCSNPTTRSWRVIVSGTQAVPATSKSVGRVRVAALPGAPGPPEDSDVGLDFRLTNVRYEYNRADYTGYVGVVVPLQITDAEPSGVSSTLVDFDLMFKVRCVATSDATIGATCAATTTANALLPGLLRDSAGAVWGMGKVEVTDAGPDFDIDTTPNHVIAAQGLYIP